MAAFTTSGDENTMRWDRRSRGFMEVWYATLNHERSGSGVWLRYTITAPQRGNAFCELWGFVFDPAGRRHFGARNRYYLDDLSGGRSGDRALVRIGDAWLSETHLEGEVSRDGVSLSWSLDMEAADRCFQHVPAALRDVLEKRVSTVCSPNLSVPFSGTVKLGNDVLELDGDKGCQSHRWGRRHSQSWAWAHCSAFDGEDDAVFEGVAARASVAGIPIPTATLLYLRHGGEDISFNDVRSMFRARSRYELPTWAFTARNDRWKIVGASRASVERLMQVRYEDPDGSTAYCANSEIGDLAVELYERVAGRWSHRASLTSMRGAHVEFGRREPFEDLPITL